MDHKRWMARAIEEAKAGYQVGEAPIAAIVVQRGTIIAVGRNTKTSERSGFAHAELNALLAARRKLGRKPKDCILYVTFEPCAMCLGAVIFSGIQTLVYGAADAEGGAIGMFRQHPTYRQWMPKVIGGVLQVECEKLLALPSVPAKAGAI